MHQHLFANQNFDSHQLELIDLCISAHQKAATNNSNISLAVTLNAFVGSGNPVGSVAAGLLSIGGTHGPITYARETLNEFWVLHNNVAFCKESLLDGFYKEIQLSGLIPGLGNSFYKDQIAPEFQHTCAKLKEMGESKSIDEYTKAFNSFLQKELYPNAALITAAVANCIGMPTPMENWFFITGRSLAWLEAMSTKTN